MYEVAKENNGAATTNALTEKRLQRQAPSAKLLRSSIHKETKRIGSQTAIGWRLVAKNSPPFRSLGRDQAPHFLRRLSCPSPFIPNTLLLINLCGL
jgi:hypothetical protein